MKHHQKNVSKGNFPALLPVTAMVGVAALLGAGVGAHAYVVGTPVAHKSPNGHAAQMAAAAAQARPKPTSPAKPGTASKPAPKPTKPAKPAPKPTKPAAKPMKPVPAPQDGTTWWKPKGNYSWQIQFTGQIVVDNAVQVYELDGGATAKNYLDSINAAGGKAICYLNAGGFEPWRPDASKFPESLLGKPMNEWKDEKWLDVRRRDVLVPIMHERMQQCKNKGFHAVDVDNIDLHTQDSGFPIKHEDQLAYTRDLVNTAHTLGLGFGMKNSVEQLPDLEKTVDFAINESCELFNECGLYKGMEKLAKPVFHISYQPRDKACLGKPTNFSSIMKKRGLDAWREPCVAKS